MYIIYENKILIFFFELHVSLWLKVSYIYVLNLLMGNNLSCFMQLQRNILKQLECVFAYNFGFHSVNLFSLQIQWIFA